MSEPLGKDLRRMIGQRLSVGFYGYDVPQDFLDFLREYQIGNIILFERNVKDDKQLALLTARLRSAVSEYTGQPPFLCIDQEGGGTSRLDKRSFPLPGAMAVAATGDPENAYLAGRLTGRKLRDVGINLNLAPVLDINSNPQNPIICERSYGDTPKQVASYGIRMMQGLLDEGILPCLKHFPGHGDTDTDSHLTLPKVEKSREELLACELLPFRRAIEAGAPAVMTAHILFPQLEPDPVPATMSFRILTDLLRRTFRFEGLILSDCLEMQAIRKFYGTTQGCIRAFEAGVDLALISHTPELAAQTVLALEEKAQSDPAFLENIRVSCERIRRIKERWLSQTPSALRTRPEYGFSALRRGKEETSPAAFSGASTESDKFTDTDYRLTRRLLEKSITLVRGALPPLGDSPLFLGCGLFCATGVENTENRGRSFPAAMRDLLGGTALEYTPETLDGLLSDPDTLRTLAQTHSSLTLGIYHADQWPEQLTLIRRLAQHSCPLTVISFKSPYELADLSDCLAAVAAWEYSEPCFEVLADMLSGKKAMEGRLPVSGI